MSARRLRCVSAIVAALMIAAGVPRTSTADASIVTHGKDITAAAVGPEAIGVTKLETVSGAIITDGAAPPFAERIDTAATYDGIAVPGPHLLISEKRIAGGLDISTPLPVVVRASVVRPEKDALTAIHLRPGAGPLTVLWSEIGGGEGARVDVALLLRAPGVTVFRSHISNALDGIRMTAGGHRVRESLIDGLITRPKDHNDGIQTSPEATDIVVERTRIMNANPQTSCILIRGSGIHIRDSYLAGGGWTLYGGFEGNGHGGPSSTGLEVSGTIFGRDFFKKSGSFGPVTYWGPGNRWSGNTYDNGGEVFSHKN